MTLPDPVAMLTLLAWALGALAMLFGAFALRRRVGLALVCVLIGTCQPLTMVLSKLFFIELLPGISVNPGSVAIFPAVLTVILLVYLREDALGVRQAVYAVLAATLATLFAALGLGAMQPLSTVDLTTVGPLFAQQWRISSAGMVMLVVDILFMLWLYERLHRLPTLLRLWSTLALALLVDALGFATLAFAGTDLFNVVLWPSLLTKQAVAPLLAGLLWVYLRVDLHGIGALHGADRLGDAIAALSYRQRFELQRAVAEDALERADRVHQAMLGSTTDALLGIDDKGIVREANRGATLVLERPLDAILGEPLQRLVACAQLIDPVRQSHPPDRHWHGLDTQRPEHPGRDLELWVTPLEDPVGEVCRVVTLRDVSERRARFDRELQHSRLESLGRLAGGVAHDFNNLLTVMLGASTLLEQDPALDDAQRTQARAVRDAAERGSELTGQLLSFARRESLPPAVVPVPQLLERLEDLLQRLVGDGISLELAIDPATPAVWTSRTQLEQAIVNLVTNARDAMPDGGRVRVACTPIAQDGDWACITVDDTGTGIAPEDLGKVFDPFYTTKPEGEGTGMGLAMALATVQQADGHLEVDSTPGAGSTFRILLPASTGAERRQDPAAEPPLQRHHGDARVLVVDDDHAVADVVHATLKTAGYRVRVAHSAAAALALLEADDGPPDLLVTDIVMPEQRGDQLVQAMEDRGWACPVVFMTGHAVGVSMEARQLRGHPVLHKPFNLAELLAVVEARLQG